MRNPIVGEMLLGKDCDKLVILGDYPNGEFSFFLGVNLVIASTFGVLFNIYILGFLENQQESKFSKKQFSDNLRILSKETKNQLFLILLIFLKIHLIAELFIVEGFIFIITGCYALGTFSIVLISSVSLSFKSRKRHTGVSTGVSRTYSTPLRGTTCSRKQSNSLPRLSVI